MAVAEVQRVQLMDATMPAWAGHFDRVEGIRERSVIELELGGGPRMLVNVADGQATLLAMGDHEITRRYAMRRRVAADLAGAVPLPAEFSPLRGPSLFPAVTSGPLGQLAVWANERTAEWVYFLSAEQDSVCDEITEAIEAVLAEEGTYTLQVIVGGRLGRDLEHRSADHRPPGRIHLAGDGMGPDRVPPARQRPTRGTAG